MSQGAALIIYEPPPKVTKDILSLPFRLRGAIGFVQNSTPLLSNLSLVINGQLALISNLIMAGAGKLQTTSP